MWAKGTVAINHKEIMRNILDDNKDNNFNNKNSKDICNNLNKKVLDYSLKYFS